MASEDATTTSGGWLPRRDGGAAREPAVALVIAWSQAEPGRIGEIAFPDEDAELLLGRGAARPDDALPRLRFHRQRPSALEPTEPLQGNGISRHQLRLRASSGELRVERIGRCRTLLGGAAADAGVVRPGDTVLLENELLLLCVLRAPELPALRSFRMKPTFAFGEADPHGVVGESPAAWALREQIAFAAPRDAHALVLGESGSGKELVARALHRLSARAPRPMIARNAATLPPGLVDAELFGNARNYPNPGMSERAGIFGEADGSTLFLDEIGELSTELQAHLLRALDAGGEYQRLGESQSRAADVRLVAATNRSAGELKHDFAARLALRVEVPGLPERREDIPLLARHLLRAMARDDAALGARFFEGWESAREAGEPRVDPALMDGLVRHRYTHHVRELGALLWSAIAGSEAHYVALTDEVQSKLSLPAPGAGERGSPSVEAIVACLDRHEGNVSQAWRELGLSSRDALNRLMKKHGIKAPPSRRGRAQR
jgi:two-component system nitrogen regulation response regulator GlnG/two-component system response regulator HydG